jgi:hypothetical protein
MRRGDDLNLSIFMRMIPFVIAPILLAGCLLGDPMAESRYYFENATTQEVRVKTIMRKGCRSSLELTHEEREFTVAAATTHTLYETRTVVEPIQPSGCFEAIQVFDPAGKLLYAQQPTDDTRWRQEPPQQDALSVSFTFTLRQKDLQAQ